MPNAISLNSETCVLSYGGACVALSKMQARIMGALLDAYPNMVATDRILEAAWPNPADRMDRQRALANLKVNIDHLMEKLGDRNIFTLRIKAQRGVGRRLVIGEFAHG